MAGNAHSSAVARIRAVTFPMEDGRTGNVTLCTNYKTCKEALCKFFDNKQQQRTARGELDLLRRKEGEDPAT